MPRFFTTDIEGGTAKITGEDAGHISRVLRMRAGEEITLCDMAGWDYKGKISALEHNQVTVALEEKCPSRGEPDIHITLYQALPKGEKMELIIQKAVELGVSRIVPVMSKRCVSRPNEKSMEKKLERYNKIALEAAKQCGRGKVPPVDPLLGFFDAVQEMKKDALPIMFYELADQPLKAALQKRGEGAISILVGSEGGFDQEEARLGKEQGLLCLSLGRRILRCETAPLCALSAIMYETNNI